MDVSKKSRMFRGLKIAFYLLGMPLFLFAVIVCSAQFMGEAPFVGNASTALFASLVKNISGAQMYGIWLACLVWLVIAIVQIIVGCTAKSFRTKTMASIAVILVVMLVPVPVIDAVYSARVDEIAASASSDVTVESYEHQLGFFRTRTSDKNSENGFIESSTDTLLKRVDAFMNIHNVPYYDNLVNTKVSNTGNTPIYSDYYKLANPTTEAADRKMVNAEPQSDGSLTWNGKNYGDAFYYLTYTETTIVNGESVSHTDYVWYDRAYRGASSDGNGADGNVYKTDGVYGSTYYNANGLLAEGCIYGVNTALEIMSQYYESYNYLKGNLSALCDIYDVTYDSDMDADAMLGVVIAKAKLVGSTKRAAYYTTGEGKAMGESGVWDGEDMYNYELSRNGDFELTGDELDTLIGALGGVLGSVGNILDGLKSLLGDGISLIGLTIKGGTDSLILSCKDKDGIDRSVTLATGVTLVEIEDFLEYFLESLQSKLIVTDGEDSVLIDPEKLNNLITDLGLGLIAGLIPVDLSAYNGDAHWLIHLVFDIVPSLGLAIDGAAVKEAFDNGEEWLKPLAVSLLQSLYSYTSPVLLPEYSTTFLVDPIAINADESDKEVYKLQNYVSMYCQTLADGKAHGSLIGSQLIGADSYGSGLYAGSAGFTEADVHQLQTDLSYQTEMYPILVFREMCIIFAGFVVLFTILYYRACERAIDPAYEKNAKPKKVKGGKKSKKDQKILDDASAEAQEDVASVNDDYALEAVEEKSQTPVEENNQKEGE